MSFTRKIRKGWNLFTQATIDRILEVSQRHYARKIDADWRSRLTNYDFTIIAPNCAAGLIYHRLGLKFLSPTINLWIEEPHYLRFCQNLHYYLEQPLNFIIPSGRWHPIALCGDVKIYFNHYNTVEEAREKWEERKKRVNWDNLYLLGDDRCLRSEVDIHTFLKIPCKNHLVFSSKDKGVGTVFIPEYCKLNMVGEYVTKKNPFTGLRSYEKAVDIVSWLNSSLPPQR